MNKLKTLLVVILVVANCASLLADNWLTSFDDAKKIALGTNKLILVDFWAAWCGPCKKMDAESWDKDEIKLLMDNYVPVKIDIDHNKSLAMQYGVKGIPYIFILDGNGKIVYEQIGYKTKNEVLALLNKYALNTTLVSADLINYHKRPNFSSAFRIATKYQDYSLKLDKSLKADFLNLSETYFKEAEKFLKDSDMKNKAVFSQKIELYQAQHFLILENPKRAEKLLEKLEVNIDSSNKDFYVFLKYLSQKMQGIENAELQSSLSEVYKSKVTLFIS